jgi:hypothetical protein
MRSIGAAQMALDSMIQRVTDPNRKTFGKFLHEHGKLALLMISQNPGISSSFSLQALSLRTLRNPAPRLNLHVSSSLAPPCRQVVFYHVYIEVLIGSGLQIDKFKAKGAMKEIAIAKASSICVAQVGRF